MLITQAEFARLAGVSRSAVKQAIDNALILSVTEKNGKKYILKDEGLKEYKENSRRQSAKPIQPPRDAPPTAQSPEPDPNGLELISWGSSAAPSEHKQPDPRPATAPKPGSSTETLPEYSKSRARSEYEKANLLELDRKAKEGLLLYREDVERAQATALNISKTRLLGVPSTAKQRIPHLALEEVEILTTLIREALDELASWEVES